MRITRLGELYNEIQNAKQRHSLCMFLQTVNLILQGVLKQAEKKELENDQ